jgi:hypothetical protein
VIVSDGQASAFTYLAKSRAFPIGLDPVHPSTCRWNCAGANLSLFGASVDLRRHCQTASYAQDKLGIEVDDCA